MPPECHNVGYKLFKANSSISEGIIQPGIVLWADADAGPHPAFLTGWHFYTAIPRYTLSEWYSNLAAAKWHLKVDGFGVFYPLDGRLHRHQVNIREGLEMLDES